MDKKKIMELVSSMKSSIQSLEAACGDMGSEEMPEDAEEIEDGEQEEGSEDTSGKKALIVSMLKKKASSY